MGCYIVDTTCGDVMSVWRRVRSYAADEVTSIIHGKAQHEETKATASQARSKAGRGHYLVVLTLEETDYVCDYIRHGGDRQAFLEKFADAHSEGFDPEMHLRTVGVANQTTMLRGETEEVQRRIRQAIIDRDGPEDGVKQFPVFRHDLRRDPGAAGCAEGDARAADEPAAGGGRLQQLEHLASGGDGRGASCRRISSATRAAWKARTQITHFDLHAGRGGHRGRLAAGGRHGGRRDGRGVVPEPSDRGDDQAVVCVPRGEVAQFA